MKKFIKSIFILVFLGVIIFFGYSFLSDKSTVLRDIINNEDKTNNYGLPVEEYGSDKDLLGGNGEDFDKLYLDVKVNKLTEEEKALSLSNAKEEIAKEDIKNNYSKLFENKKYTNSNYEYVLNENTATYANWFKFRDDFYTEFEKAVARGENFLMYNSKMNPSDRNSNFENVNYPSIYAYVDGLGYIIGTSTPRGLFLTVNNKYFSKLTKENKIDKEIKVETWYSNEDTVKVQVAGVNNFKKVFLDYTPNMIRTTAQGFFKAYHDFDYSFTADPNYGYCLYEGNFMNLAGSDKAQHLYGMGTYWNPASRSKEYIPNEKGGLDICIYHADKDNAFYWVGDPKGSGDSNTRYLTDFNNFYMSIGYAPYTYENNYALFGKLADNFLSKLVAMMFEGELKPCNDFESDCIGEVKTVPYVEDLFWTVYMNTVDGYDEYIYPTESEFRAFERRDDIYHAQKEGFDGYDKWYYCNAEWYRSFSEENRPYINSYVVRNNKLTVRHWSREKGIIYTDLENNTLVFERDVETFDDYAKPILESLGYEVIWYEYEYDGITRGYWTTTTPIPRWEKPHLIQVMQYLYEENVLNIDKVDDSSNIFNSRFN